MKVRVKKGQSGFIYGALRKEGEEITLKPVTSTDGKETTISVEDQFSDVWMEKVKSVGRQKAVKASKEEESED